MMANELLSEVQRLAVSVQFYGSIPHGFLIEMVSNDPESPNWSVHWQELGENDRLFADALRDLRNRYPRVDWTGVLRSLP